MMRMAYGLSLLAAGMVLATCGGDEREGEGSPAPDGPPVSGSFIGTVAGTDAQITVVAGKAGGGERPVRAYVCATEVVAEWFTGSAGGNGVRLRSTTGSSSLTAELAPDRVEGQVRLPDGTTHGFAARRATGIAGLYEVTVGRDGRVVGSSDRGVRLTGRIHERGLERRALTATLVGPDGERRRIADETTGRPPFGATGEGRWIIDARGRLSGSVKAEDEPAIWAGPNPR